MIELRKLEWGDVDGVHSLLSRMDVVQHMLFSVYSREESEKFVRDSLVESPSEQCWKSIVRAVSDSGTGTLVGLGGLVIMRGAEEGEIWYLVDPDSWGKGVATETATRLLNLGFGELG